MAVLAVALVLVVYGLRRGPAGAAGAGRVVRIDGLGLDGLRVVVLTDTHYGPIDRARWSARVVEVVNGLRPDLVVHLGDLADGSVARRGRAGRAARRRARPPAGTTSPATTSTTAGAAQWVEHMRGLGWEPLDNRHRSSSAATGWCSRASTTPPGAAPTSADHARRWPAPTPRCRCCCSPTSPSQVAAAAAAGVDLQLSGHTHGGQIWPFHFLVRTNQPVLAGLSRHGARTQLYTSRGTGFWGPPLRVFAPSEITVLTLGA